VLRFAVILSTPMWLALGGWYVFVAVLLYGMGEILDRRFSRASLPAAQSQPVAEPAEIPAVANSGGC
jgi:hypothetical protein